MYPLVLFVCSTTGRPRKQTDLSQYLGTHTHRHTHTRLHNSMVLHSSLHVPKGNVQIQGNGSEFFLFHELFQQIWWKLPTWAVRTHCVCCFRKFKSLHWSVSVPGKESLFYQSTLNCTPGKNDATTESHSQRLQSNFQFIHSTNVYWLSTMYQVLF